MQECDLSTLLLSRIVFSGESILRSSDDDDDYHGNAARPPAKTVARSSTYPFFLKVVRYTTKMNNERLSLRNNHMVTHTHIVVEGGQTGLCI